MRLILLPVFKDVSGAITCYTGTQLQNCRKPKPFTLDLSGYYNRATLIPNLKNMAHSETNSKGQTYFLHGKMVTLRGGRKQQIYYFSRKEKADALDALPTGYEVMENKRTGLPMLRKAGGKK